VMLNKFTKTAGVLKPLWQGETSSAYGGGAHGLSNRFVAGYNWLDKLGMSATFGHQVLIRQSFYHGCYALIGEDLEPFPDFWLSVLFKRLVGPTVLKMNISNRGRSVRLYTHCAAQKEGYVTLFGFNMMEKPVSISIEKTSKIDAYVLTPKGGNVTSDAVLLNGTPLNLVDNKSMPNLKPETIVGKVISLPPRAIAFWVLPDVWTTEC